MVGPTSLKIYGKWIRILENLKSGLADLDDMERVRVPVDPTGPDKVLFNSRFILWDVWS